MSGVGELEAAACESHMLSLIKRLDFGKGVHYTLLRDILLEDPWASLLDKGLIYEPVMGILKVIE